MLSGFFAALALLRASILPLRSQSDANADFACPLRNHRIVWFDVLCCVLWLILRETLALTLLGMAVGIPSALAATQLIARMLFGISRDVPTIAGVSFLLMLVTLFTGYLPARRASTIDPIVALRSE
jgi:hypothetical protein